VAAPRASGSVPLTSPTGQDAADAGTTPGTTAGLPAPGPRGARGWLGKRTTAAPAAVPTAPPAPAPGAAPVGKGRPTPKRSEKERRTGPVAPPPQTRKEAAKRQREQQLADRGPRRSGADAHDQTRMMARDRGPVRALVRDVVDSRRNIGVLLLPLALLLVAAQLVGNDRVLSIATRVWSAGLLALVIDLGLLAWRVRRTLATTHPTEGRTSRHIGYAVLRSTVLRRLRQPPPRVGPGDEVGARQP
jgi:Protein of unknown function (DUF3043)